AVLDVVLSTAVTNGSVEHATAMTPIYVPNAERVVEDLSDSKIKLTFKDVVALAQKKAPESEIEQQLISSMPLEIQAR
ncbi:hypothetical protein BGZ65_000791, partial [Modicella reniformis]